MPESNVFHFPLFRLRYQIDSPRMKRVAAKNPKDRKEDSPKTSVLFQCFFGIVRARRIKSTAVPQIRGNGRAVKCEGGLHPFLIRRNREPSSFFASGVGSPFTFLRTMITWSPNGRLSIPSVRNESRINRFHRFRTTAPPVSRVTISPRRFRPSLLPRK